MYKNYLVPLRETENKSRKYIPVAFFKTGGYKIGKIVRNETQVFDLQHGIPENGDRVCFIKYPERVKVIRWLVLERN